MTIAGVLVATMLLPGLATPGPHQAPVRDTRPVRAVTATAAIRGVVMSDEVQPRPLRRVLVSISGREHEVDRTVITADDGSFAFTALPPGSYTVSAAKEAYVATGATRSGLQAAPVPLRAGETARVTLRLARGAVITGTVLDADGTPVQGISVLAMARRFSGTGAYRYVPARAAALPTDDRGLYRIYGLPAGDYVVAAQPGQSNGPGVPGTNAALRPMTQGAPGGRSFTMTQVYYPSALDPAQAMRLTVRGGEERSGIDVQLQYVPLATISGTVAFAPGGMEPTVAAYPVSSELWPTWVRSGRADAAGAFTLGPLPPGQYQVVARRLDGPHRFSVATADVTLDGNDVGNLALSPQSAPGVTGLLVFRGDATPPVFGTEWSDPTALHSSMDYSPAMQVDGVRFTIQGTVPGRYYLGGNIMGVRRARSGWWLQSLTAGGVELLDAPVDLRRTVDNAVAVFTDRASVLSGLVVDAGGNPVPDATVVAFSLDRSTWFYQSRRVAGVKPDAAGRYVIRNLPPGEYRVAAVMGLDVNEWFDAAVLEGLLGLSLRLTIAGNAPQTLDLTIR